MYKNPLLLCWLLLLSSGLAAQSQYQNFAQLSNSLKQLQSKHSTAAQLKSIGKSEQGRELWLLSLSRGGKPESKPAIFIVAGLDAHHLAGVESSLLIAESILQKAGSNDSIRQLLESKTLYFLPCANPDAYEQAFAKLKYERALNATRSDNDRDGRLDEDGFDDLNADGLITMMRIADPTGSYIIHKDDTRVMVKADAAKGEKGQYLLLSEGIDNDKDGLWNEDGEGGIHLNKNFTHGYPYFSDGSGEFAVSAPESRALLDFLYEAKNVYAVFQFGLHNNLTEPHKYDRAKASQKIVAGWQEKDVAVNDLASKLYGKKGLKDLPSGQAGGGHFSQWAYYHYGRFSFGTPVWGLPKDTAKNKSDNEDIRFLRWAAAQQIPNIFVDWKAVKHPDFPNQTVEVGGFAPFVKLNPPPALLKENTEKHARFFETFAEAMPQLQIQNIRTERVSDGLTRISIDLHNQGLMPTHTQLGERTRHVDKIKVKLQTNGKQTILAGKNTEVLRSALGGGEKLELSWLILGSGAVQIEVGSATAGSDRKSISLP